MSGEQDNEDFVVIDRRAASGSAEETSETAAPSAPGTEPRAEEPATGSAAPSGDAPGSRERASPAPPDFAMLVQPFFVAALYHMGLAADPETGQPGPRNLPLARHNIDLLEVIADKTRGNLDDEEKKLLEGVLYELRMSFVKVGRVPSE